MSKILANIGTINTDDIILVDLDNTLVFTDKANNMAYLQAIKQFLPHVALPQTQRITREFIQQNLPSIDKRIFNQIIEYKQSHFIHFLELTELNQEVYEWLLEHPNNPIYLVTNAHQERAKQLLNYYQISELFDKQFYVKDEVNKYSEIINLENKVIIFDDEIKQLRFWEKFDNVRVFLIKGNKYG